MLMEEQLVALEEGVLQQYSGVDVAVEALTDGPDVPCGARGRDIVANLAEAGIQATVREFSSGAYFLFLSAPELGTEVKRVAAEVILEYGLIVVDPITYDVVTEWRQRFQLSEPEFVDARSTRRSNEIFNAILEYVEAHENFGRLQPGGYRTGVRGKGWWVRGQVLVGGLSIGVTRDDDVVAFDAQLIPSKVWQDLFNQYRELADGDDAPSLDNGLYMHPMFDTSETVWHIPIETRLGSQKRRSLIEESKSRIDGWFRRLDL